MMLPQWLQDVLPELTEPIRVTYEDGMNIIHWADEREDVKIDCADLKGLQNALRNWDYVLDDSFMEFHGDSEFKDMGVFFPVSKKFSGWLHSYSDADRLRSLERDFETALRAHIRYESDPTDWINAYNFVDHHPAFWTNERLEEHPWYWTTSGHCRRLYQMVGRTKGETYVGFETGGHIKGDSHSGAGNYSGHYHDYRLDCYGRNFEEAFIKLAELVNKFFYPDGSDRPDVEHEKPNWIIELEERIKELDEEEDGPAND